VPLHKLGKEIRLSAAERLRSGYGTGIRMRRQSNSDRGRSDFAGEKNDWQCVASAQVS
jgi:hypothetical protein